MKTTFMQKKEEVVRDWYIIDAKNMPLGRVASKAAVMLRGKHKATYTPTYMYKNPSKSTKKFKILDINTEIKKYESKASGAVSKSLYNTLVTERKNIKRIIGNEIK